MINEDFLKANINDFGKNFYVCGPPPMMDAVLKQLANLGAPDDLITMEI
jgi:ferredoxin-NADP reductase